MQRQTRKNININNFPCSGIINCQRIPLCIPTRIKYSKINSEFGIASDNENIFLFDQFTTNLASVRKIPNFEDCKIVVQVFPLIPKPGMISRAIKDFIHANRNIDDSVPNKISDYQCWKVVKVVEVIFNNAGSI